MKEITVIHNHTSQDINPGGKTWVEGTCREDGTNVVVEMTETQSDDYFAALKKHLSPVLAVTRGDQPGGYVLDSLRVVG